MTGRRRLIVGMSGASGAVYGVRILELLRAAGIETHLVVSKAAELTRAHELGLSPKALRELADHAYAPAEIGAAIASGSFRTMGMIVAPCSVRTLAEIATGVSGSLLTRAADVVLKERRRLVLLVRETPLNLVHLRNMVTVTEAGGIVMPPVPALYGRPQTIDEMVSHTAARALDLFDIEVPALKRWGEELSLGPAPGAADRTAD
ncbi:MAG: UbiX family flavin prenyltransferase [Geminicoccaceae bacterium]